jgi:serine/threonine protein phosphatase PrpC
VENKALEFARSYYEFGMPELSKIGACALLVLVVNNTVYAANAGDSQGLLISEEKGKYNFEKLNKKLNADSRKEQKRLK